MQKRLITPLGEIFCVLTAAVIDRQAGLQRAVVLCLPEALFHRMAGSLRYELSDTNQCLADLIGWPAKVRIAIAMVKDGPIAIIWSFHRADRCQ